MNLLDLTLPSPARNLACDEALLNWHDEKNEGATLRFWESGEIFVVTGYANKITTEVNMTACHAENIPVFRRCSGGGTVIQGPGCLNYSLILPIVEDGPLQNISIANQYIMRRNRAAIDTLIPAASPGGRRRHVAIRGHTDLAIGDRKFSGNSQRRHKRYLLFHGTFLLNFDLTLTARYLNMPSKQPDYRENRTHDQFITNLQLPAAEVKEAVKKAWQAGEPLRDPPLERIDALAEQKYATHEWNYKF